EEKAGRTRELLGKCGVAVSGLGYYPNPLDPDPAHRRAVVEHLGKVMDAAGRLGVPVVNTFVGRDPARSIEAQWPLVLEVWPPLLRRAGAAGVKVGIENCPMLFGKDEWRGGKNLAGARAGGRGRVQGWPGAEAG